MLGSTVNSSSQDICWVQQRPLTQFAKKEKVDVTLMAVDVEKVFDRLEWSYLYEVLDTYDFPKEIIQLIKTVYKSPKAYVYSKGILSDAIQTTRGTRQGCLLSPSLFALAVEPLAQKIHQSDKISGINIGGECYKLGLYADDMMLY